jgi:hypothetical protein
MPVGVPLDQGHDIHKVDTQIAHRLECGDPVLIPAPPPVDGIDELFVLIFTVAPQRQSLLLGRHTVSIEAHQFAKLLVISLNAAFILHVRDRPHRAIGDGIVLAGAIAHL